MLESLIHFVSSSAEVGAAASQTPHTAVAAILCAALLGLFS
ncbi:YshB family small membrane protein [Atlantibacter hermannii]|nr:YshB family small membrane protein [Atlantibacter hermannii]NBC98749.1 YshB family small membrane protein [Atlantibacter hermannii]